MPNIKLKNKKYSNLMLRSFVEGLLDPEQNGYNVSPFIRDEARRALGLKPCETELPTLVKNTSN